MHSCWLAKHERSSCILFFSGWGMDPAPFRDMPAAGHDLLMLYDYRDLDLARIGEMLPEGYGHLYLVAWSMGVWVAGLLPGSCRNRFAAAIAVNGTTTPIDERRGIDPKAYDDMIGAFSARTLEGFYREMFDDRRQAARFFRNRPRRPAESILEELVTLRRAYLEHGPSADIFTRRIVGSRDRIFPARSQIRAWGRDRCTTLPLPHFPFYALTDWRVFPGAA